MANNKLTWTELRRLLASRAGVKESEANAFLSTLNEQLIEALKKDKQVKINGLGTFRLQSVAPRRSVSVSSGQEMTIERYNKIVFTPESGVKELVINAPVAAKNADANEEINPLKKLGDQAEEIVDILADLGQAPKTKKEPKEEKPKKKIVKKKVVVKPQPVTPEPVKIEEPEPVKVEEPGPLKAEEPKPVEIATPVEPEKPAKPEQPEKPKKKYHFLRDTLICVICLLLLLLIGYFFLRNQLTSLINSIGKDKTGQTELVEPKAQQTDTLPANIEGTSNQSRTDFESDTVLKETEKETPKEIVYDNLITTEPMHEASRLTWMAKRYYGNKDYWPYLYDANKDRITNPNKITVGTPIRVPKLTAEQMDTTIESSRLTLHRLREEAEAACKK